MSAAVDWDDLRQAALDARAHAHAPYSGFRVGAALLAEDGRVFVGVNVENASYGLTQCAERAAITAAVAAGARRFIGIAIVTGAKQPTPPCGACRQVLQEFPPAFQVRSYTTDGAVHCDTTDALLPGAFGPDSM